MTGRTAFMDDIEKKILKYIQLHNLPVPGNRLLLSLSAGKDSMALLHMLIALREELALDFEIFHLNHLSRGEASDADEMFLHEMARRLNVPIAIERVDVMRTRPGGSSFEEHARRVRYALAEEIARKRHCDAIATAHTLDDSVETMMMRIFQGTGIHGLRGIEPHRGNIIRPLLCLSSEEVYAYLRTHGVQWRDDATNFDVRYVRNYVRHTIIPIVKKRFPDYQSAIERLSKIARDEGSLVDALVAQCYGEAVFRRTDEGIIIELAKICGNDVLVKYLLSRAFHELGGYISTAMIDDIVRKLKSRRAHTELFCGRGLRAVKTRQGDAPIVLIHHHTDFENEGDWEYSILLSQLPCTIEIKEAGFALKLYYAEEDFFASHKTEINIAFIAISTSEEKLSVRSRRRGDRISLRDGEKKLKDLFIDAKLSPQQKKLIPVVEVGGKIAAVLTGIAVGGHNRIAEGFLVKSGAKKILAIQRA